MTNKIPLLIAGPFLRHTSVDEICVTLVTSQLCAPEITLTQLGRKITFTPRHVNQDCLPLGKNAFLHIIHVHKADLFKVDSPFTYDIQVDDKSLCLSNTSTKCYVPSQLTNVMHGSCRKIHSEGHDALPTVVGLLESDERPDILFLTGDQVYVDDVAGPTLHAINQVITLLGLHQESFTDGVVQCSNDLCGHAYGYYLRESLLPDSEANETLDKVFFRAKRKPLFTSVNAQNHLMSFAEICALYLLSFSPVMWKFIEFDESVAPDEFRDRYRKEQQIVETFVEGLESVQTVLARIPTYMIFDDHDITDDWNLNRAWEEAVYGNPFSKRIIGNALLGYTLFQGIGNQPKRFTPLRRLLKKHLLKTKIKAHDELLEAIFDWEKWHYSLDTQPPVRVLDTRTRRWRSESNPQKPSGLMEWEALVNFQQSIVGHDNVIVVSAAPIYGMKFIEMIQRVFTWFGQALTVDAENWMAHKGTANVMLNIFRHIKTPPRFMILSGDVHYSFVYDVRMRFRRNSPQVLQFTCSGIKNQFPDQLLRFFDHLNRLFYSSRSPLNFLTKRRFMKITERKPFGYDAAEHINPCAMGVLQLPNRSEFDLSEVKCTLLCADQSKIPFEDM